MERKPFVNVAKFVETKSRCLGTLILSISFLLAVGPRISYAQKAATKPNILVIMGDDIGWLNPSCYNRGMMGYQTPNIDRIAKEGALFNCWYGQQSCTAGRAAFIIWVTGTSFYRQITDSMNFSGICIT